MGRRGNSYIPWMDLIRSLKKKSLISQTYNEDSLFNIQQMSNNFFYVMYYSRQRFTGKRAKNVSTNLLTAQHLLRDGQWRRWSKILSFDSFHFLTLSGAIPDATWGEKSASSLITIHNGAVVITAFFVSRRYENYGKWQYFAICEVLHGCQ